MIVLDTHAWIWYIDAPETLSPRALSAIEQARRDKSVFVSCISAWEIHMLAQRGRLRLSVEPQVWVSRCERLSFFRFLPVDNEIARLAVNLPGEFHADPADRFIVATARYLGAPLATKDAKIQGYPHVTALW